MFKKEIELVTRLSLDEIQDKLNSITERYFSGRSKNTFFEGKIENSKFRILPTFNYGNRGKLRPELKGNILESDRLCKIQILFKLPRLLRILLLTALIGNLTLVLIMVIFPSLVDHPLWTMWWLLLLNVIITYFLFLLYFNFKVRKSISILKRNLMAR